PRGQRLVVEVRGPGNDDQHCGQHAEREVETGEQRGPVLLRPAAPEDGRRKTEDGSAAFPALAFRLPPPAWWGDVLLPPAHDVQAQAGDAEGAEQAESIEI